MVKQSIAGEPTITANRHGWYASYYQCGGTGYSSRQIP